MTSSSRQTLLALVGGLLAGCDALASGAAPARAAASRAVGRRAPVRMGAEPTPTRRSVLSALVAAPAALVLAPPLPALAGDSKANVRLASLGFPPLPSVGGYFQLAEFLGRASAANIDGEKTRGFKLDSPLLVAFNYPQTWVTALPTISSNGESGTVSAGNYIKGDSAAFVVFNPAIASEFNPTANNQAASQGAALSKETLARTVVASATSDVYQDVKVKNVKPREGAGDYVTFDYTYTLLTRAGFEVDRHGVGSATVLSDGQVGALVTATTALRWKGEESKLRELTKSFVVYKLKKSDVQQLTEIEQEA